MNDEMTMLRAAGTDLDPPGGAPAALRERVVAGFVADGGAGAPDRAVAGDVIRMPRPWGRRVALVGGVAAALTGAMVLGPTLGGSGDGEQPGLGIDAAAAAVLQDAAAAEAEQEPWAPRPDQFVYTKSVSSYYEMSDGVEVLTTGSDETWTSVDGLHTGLSEGWTEPNELYPDGRRGSEQLTPCAEGDESWCADLPAYPQDLPTDGDVDVMLQYLRDNAVPTLDPYPTEWPEAIPDTGTFERAEELLALGSLPPQARSAVFGAVALISGVTVTGETADAAGRPGIAVGFTYAQGTRDELIFDEETNEFLGFRQLWAPDKLADGVPATEDGAMYDVALLESGIVDEVGQKP
ncbi:CU044_5270 family protein [Promicromonospora sp. NPDC023805]|uniref:CU044_5270 family protein n=1 Tax=Promicromonospora sp. NPDC023805 TaxID=3154696 RepID=UPI0033EAC741